MSCVCVCAWVGVDDLGTTQNNVQHACKSLGVCVLGRVSCTRPPVPWMVLMHGTTLNMLALPCVCVLSSGPSCTHPHTAPVRAVTLTHMTVNIRVMGSVIMFWFGSSIKGTRLTPVAVRHIAMTTTLTGTAVNLERLLCKNGVFTWCRHWHRMFRHCSGAPPVKQRYMAGRRRGFVFCTQNDGVVTQRARGEQQATGTRKHFRCHAGLQLSDGQVGVDGSTECRHAGPWCVSHRPCFSERPFRPFSFLKNRSDTRIT